KSNKAPEAIPHSVWDPKLNPKLNFNNFLVGSSNEIARSIALKIAEEPGKRFNPFLLFGQTGVGKTHLSQAIGNRILELNPQKKVLYISAHSFEIQFTEARKKNTHNEFVHFYQGVDVLILDDIHELAGKEKTQQSYFHIFNHLKLIGKQLILTADKAPADIQGLEERLTSRLKWGLMLELQKPDLELRKKIIYNRAKQDGITIADEFIDYIATHVTDHIRELEGIIVSLVARSIVERKEIDMEVVRQIVSKVVKIQKKVITIDCIKQTVSSYYKLDMQDILSTSRKREMALARQVIMYFAKNYTNYSCAHIGSLVGGRDHATVIHAINTVRNMMETNKVFNAAIKEMDSWIAN
ncbi:MAG: chromosomal replication initiator protein DnaA, partial [Candidatus Symbiothrix sp.]|nr:chromosomal replication initiator protein DnaA [Candidatus Symbiothrix sp.]